MRRSIILVLLLAEAIAAQVPQYHVYVAIDDDAILALPERTSDANVLTRDAAIALLVEPLLASSPVEQWPTVTLAGPTTYEQLIDRYYDYYPAQFPDTVALLKRWMLEANKDKPLVARTTISLPPIPKKAYEKPVVNPIVRTYVPQTNGYDVQASVEDMTFELEPQAVRPATPDDPDRRRGITVFTFPTRDEAYRAFPRNVRAKLGGVVTTWVGTSAAQVTQANTARVRGRTSAQLAPPAANWPMLMEPLSVPTITVLDDVAAPTITAITARVITIPEHLGAVAALDVHSTGAETVPSPVLATPVVSPDHVLPNPPVPPAETAAAPTLEANVVPDAVESHAPASSAAVSAEEAPSPWDLTAPPLVVEFFAGATDNPSPFIQSMIDRLTPIDRQLMVERAARRPLVIIDFDFDEGHGKKVREVARLALRHFELEDDLNALIDTVDLNPRTETSLARLRELIEQYLETLPAATRKNNGQFVNTERWLREYESPKGRFQQIDQGVLQAVLWYALKHRQAWVNMSFIVRATNVDYDALMLPPAGAAVVAAGEGTGEIVVAFPQRIAAEYDEALNVTYGEPDGTIKGPVSAKVSKVKVHVLAPGSGFAGEFITQEEAGTSFAAPWVAVAGWVKELRDLVAKPDIVRLMKEARRPIPPISKLVESGGYFDPTLLLAFTTPPRHLLTQSNQLTVFDVARLSYRYQDDAVDALPCADRREEVVIINAASNEHGTLTVADCPSGQGLCVWHHHQLRQPPEVPAWPLRVCDFRFVASAQGTGVTDIQSVGLFKELYRELRY